jgi:microsomal dipeptidase-like Zn-dependent dipeptidase
LTPERRADYDKQLAEIDAKWPAAGRATVKDFVNHIDYAVKLIGIDHVGAAICCASGETSKRLQNLSRKINNSL